MKHTEMNQNNRTFQRPRCQITITGDWVYKLHKHENKFGEHERELLWLNKLRSWDRSPGLINSFFNQIIMEYRGEPLSKNNLPPNVWEQIGLISEGLKFNNCSHNDISEEDLVVNENGFISIIDFEWATNIGSDIPDSWPKNMGYKYRLKGKRNDAYALSCSVNSTRRIND